MSGSTETAGRGVTRRTGPALSLDLSMVLLLCVLKCRAMTGITWHEWLGFVFSALIFSHVAWRWRWFGEQFRRMLMPGAYRVRINSLLNIALLVTMAALLASGIFISHQVSPLMGEHFGRTQVWQEIHDCSNIVVLVLVSLHLGFNWDWIIAKIRRRGAGRTAPAGMASPPPDRSNLWNRLAGGMVIASIAGLGVFATYLATAAMLGPEIARANIQTQQNAARFSGERPNGPVPRHGHPEVVPGLELFGSTLLGVLLIALIVRYIFRLHL